MRRADLTWSVKDPRNNEIAKGTGQSERVRRVRFQIQAARQRESRIRHASIFRRTAAFREAASRTNFRYRNFAGPNLRFRRRSKPKRRILSAARRTSRSKRNIMRAAGWRMPKRTGRLRRRRRITRRRIAAISRSARGCRGGDSTITADRGGYVRRRTTQTFKGVTDASGKHLLKIDFDSVKPPRPYAISASASVQDVNRQTWASTDVAARASGVALCRHQNAADVCPERRKDRRRIDRLRYRRQSDRRPRRRDQSRSERLAVR